MSTRRSTSNRDAADAATTEEAQGREVSGGSSQSPLNWFYFYIYSSQHVL